MPPGAPPSRLLRTRALLVAGTAVLVLAGCGSPGGTGSASHDSAAPDLTGSSAPAEQRAPAPPAPGTDGTGEESPPVDVLFTGDSVMQQVATAMVDAIDGPEVNATFASTIAIADQPETVVGWQTVMAVDPPDLVVVMVGTWEREAVRSGLQQGGWPEPYLTQVAAFVETVTGAGAELVWMTYPPAAGDEATDVAALNQALAALPTRFEGVEVIDAGSTVAGPTGERVQVVSAADGAELVVRDTSVHLCPDGAVLMATPVVDHLVTTLGVTPNPGWQEGEWRRDPALFTDPASCSG